MCSFPCQWRIAPISPLNFIMDISVQSCSVQPLRVWALSRAQRLSVASVLESWHCQRTGNDTKLGGILCIHFPMMSTSPDPRQMGPGEQTAPGHEMARTTTVSLPGPWQGKTSAGNQLLTAFWPLALLAFPRDLFASEDFSQGLSQLCVSLQLWPELSSCLFCLKCWEGWWHSQRDQYLGLLAMEGEISPTNPNHNSGEVLNINMKLGMHTQTPNEIVNKNTN